MEGKGFAWAMRVRAEEPKKVAVVKKKEPPEGG